MLGTKEGDKGDYVMSPRIPSSAVESGKCPSDQETCWQVRRAEKGQKALGRGWKGKQSLPQRWGIYRGGGISGRGNSVSHESKLERTEHAGVQAVKFLSVVSRIMPLPKISTSQSLGPQTRLCYVAKGN